MMTILQPELDLTDLLEKLNHNELKSFKTQLKTLPEFGVGRLGSSFSEVEEANATDLSEILMERLPGNRLRHVTLRILEKISCPELSQISEESQAPQTKDAELKHMEAISEKEKQGKKERLRLMMKKMASIWKNKLRVKKSDYVHNVTQRSQDSIPFLSSQISLTYTAVLHGPAGVGKTTVAARYLQEWMEGSQSQVFQCAFYLSCRELNHMMPCTFVELISKDCSECRDCLRELLSQAQEVLFVVDGFDELRIPLGAPICDICDDWVVEKPVSILLDSLLRRKMVPKARILVTTRPQALEKLLSLVEKPYLVEVEGFLEGDRQEYFLRHFGDKERALQAFDAMKSNSALFHMGSAPAVCWIVCTYLELLMDRRKDLTVACQTCTALFLQFLCSQFPPSSNEHSNEHFRALLEGLCLLAARGLWTQLSVFNKDDIRELGLKESDLTPFLDTRILQRTGDSGGCYFFIHISIQQLLAAMFYLLQHQEEEEGGQCFKWDVESIHKLFSKEARFQNPNLAQTGLFLFGLLNEKLAEELETTFGCRTSMEVKEELLQCGSKENDSVFSLMDLQEVFSCLYESQDEDLVHEAMAPYEEIALHLKTTRDLIHASFCLKSCKRLKRLSLRVAKGIFLEKETALAAYLKGVRIKGSNRPLCVWEDLCSTISSHKNLSLLDISQSFLNDPAVRILCNYMTHTSWCLQEVVIKDVSPASANGDLCLALTGKKTLTHLTLVGRVKETKSQQLLLLGEMFKHKNCSLQFLRLRYCLASIEQWDDFFLTLHNNQSLTYLDLSNNNLLDEGAMMMSMVLRYPRCSLKRLSLENCNLTQVCCKDLSSALMVNQKLTHLSLAKNHLGDAGVKILCEGLGYAECKLQTLVLQECNITKQGCEHLSKLLQGNCTLTHLDLSLNPIAMGLCLLCNALKNPNLKLKFLGLSMCSLMSLHCQDLASALTSNQSLETLDVGQNLLGKSGIMEILESLKGRNGPLKTVRLSIDELNVKIEKLLQEVKEKNPSLNIERITRREPSYCDIFSEI